MEAAKWIRFAVLASFSALFFWLFYVRYWKFHDCIEAARSSCITPQGDNLIPAGAFWIFPALLFLALSIWNLKSSVKARPSG